MRTVYVERCVFIVFISSQIIHDHRDHNAPGNLHIIHGPDRTQAKQRKTAPHLTPKCRDASTDVPPRLSACGPRCTTKRAYTSSRLIGSPLLRLPPSGIVTPALIGFLCPCCLPFAEGFQWYFTIIAVKGRFTVENEGQRGNVAVALSLGSLGLHVCT